MDKYERAAKAVQECHRVDTFWAAGGHGWSCSCGIVRHPGTGYPTQKQAYARASRHIRALWRNAIEKGD